MGWFFQPRSVKMDDPEDRSPLQKSKLILEFWEKLDELGPEKLERLNRHFGIVKLLASSQPTFVAAAYAVPITAPLDVKSVIHRLQIRTRIRDRFFKRHTPPPLQPRIATMYLVTLPSSVPTDEIDEQMRQHGLQKGDLSHLLAFINANPCAVCDERIICFEDVTMLASKAVRRVPCSVVRDSKRRMLLRIHKPNFWLKEASDQDPLPPRHQFLAVPDLRARAKNTPSPS
ncbi:hypothetical protein GF380_01990 [Candidatus Uhrbacteria bacterium]|nr:hypothetical protein [Candidatus Uhrbacteria bacterium]